LLFLALGNFCLLAAGFEDATQSAFLQFVKSYNKNYAVDEFFNKYEVFKANLALINAHNQQKSSWQMGINQFADLTREEFKKVYLGTFASSNLRALKNAERRPRNGAADPSLDWRTKGAVGPVKEQGQCASDWAFAVTGSIAAACYIATHNLTQHSAQMLMDCSASVGNEGCNGGFIDKTFEWIEKNPLVPDTCYPYTGMGGTCHHKCPPIKWCVVTGFTDVKQGDEESLMEAVNKEPVVVAIEADQSSFQFYRGGVMDGTCGKDLDHAVLLIGYGTEAGKQYWTIQNSWGTSFGEQGYIRMIRGIDQCGIADAASYPLVKAG